MLDRSVPENFGTVMERLNGVDLRLGQFFSNLDCFIKQDGKDMFYLENDELMGYIEKYFKTWEKTDEGD